MKLTYEWHKKSSSKSTSSFLNNPELEGFCWTISINKYVQLPAKNAKSRSKNAEDARTLPEIPEPWWKCPK